MSADDELLTVAALQHGFALRGDARAFGLSRSALRHRVRRGDWDAHGPRVLHRRGTPWTKASPLMRAVLDAGPGSVISHTTAAAWWGLPGFDLMTVHVTRHRALTSAPARFADQLHAVLDLSSRQVTVLEGVPIVRPERMIFELCATAHPKRAERALENGWSRGLYSGDSLRRIHEELAEQGRAGTVLLREFLEVRPPGWVPPASNLERRFMAIAADECLGAWRRQVDLGGAQGWCGRVDFLHEALPVVVEVQSERYHTALLDVAADAARRARLEAAGFLVVEVWDSQLWYARHEVVTRVREGLRAARSGSLIGTRA